MNESQLHELLFQALETELGGVQVYDAAITCALNEQFRSELEEYRAQTVQHVEFAKTLLEAFGLDPSQETPGRSVVRHLGKALVSSIQMAQKEGPPQAAELVAAECVTLAETKDHLNWELLGEVADELSGEQERVLRATCDEVSQQEDEHLYHSVGWGRELWIDSLGLPAVLPPPEEQKDVKTAIGAARAKQQRDKMDRRAS